MNKSQRDLRTFMAIAQEQAIAEAKLIPSTPESRREAEAIVDWARDRMAAMRREERAKRPSNVVSGAIRAAIMAMNPAQIIARLTEVRAMYPDMQFAHRDYEHLSETDLRSALEDVESLIERGN
jgi:hypothetical protein